MDRGALSFIICNCFQKNVDKYIRKPQWSTTAPKNLLRLNLRHYRHYQHRVSAHSCSC